MEKNIDRTTGAQNNNFIQSRPASNGVNEETKTPPPEITPEVETRDEKRRAFRTEAWETVRFLLVAFAIVIPIRIFIAQPFIVSGTSMFPTFKDKQYLIVDELSYRIGEPSRGDVVIFKYPKNPEQYFIKRVIGLPGETVLVDAGGEVSIKDAAGKTVILKEPYTVHTREDIVERTLKSGEYFMMGDNRGASFDSRAWGPVDRNLIVGKAFLRLFPLDTLAVVPGQFRQ